ncbi:MAG: flagellar hook-length control protein FliK, partial [Pseudomonas sp.]|nr:flagellar hook-length control protein FliK [Pseudomonas sp.]
MSVVPDLLLQPAAKTKARTAAKAPTAAPPQSQRKAADFAQVYARERQDKAVERAEPVAKGARERFCGCADEAPASEPQVSQETVAASGKALPVEEAVATEVAAAASTSADA